MHYPCQRSLPRPLSTPAYASASTASLRRWPRPPASTLTPRKTIIAGIGGFATSRLTTPEEIATLITYLASDRTAKITGASYLIDSGLTKAIRGQGMPSLNPQLTGSGADHAGDERRSPRGVPGTRTTAPHGSTEQSVLCDIPASPRHIRQQ